MQQVLKQSAAATTIVGPILDSTGAAYTGAVIADLNLTKNGTTAAMAAAATLTHDHNGHYILVFTTGNTDTLGRLDVTCNKATYAMPPKCFEVLAAAAFDTLVTNGTLASTTSGRTIATAATGEVDANAVKWAGTATVLAASLPSVSAVVTSMSNGVIAAATFGAGAITATVIADGAIDNATFAADTGLQTIRSNTAQAGAAGSITLDASASATTDFYKDEWVYLTGGAGVGQARLVTAYNGSTKVASVTPNWATNPDVTTTFAVVPAAYVAGVQGNVSGSVGSVTGAVGSVTGGVTVTTNNDKTGYSLTQTFPANFSALSITAGGVASADAVAVSGDTAAADNLETMLDGTGGQVLSLKQLNVVNSAGDAAVFSSTGSNGHGIQASGNGTGAGIRAAGGAADGPGFRVTGGGTAGLGIYATGVGSSAGFYISPAMQVGGVDIHTYVWSATTRVLTAGTNINGSTFTSIPWNAAWDAEVQSEAQDAIEANHLDHLIAVADPGSVVSDNSFLAKLTSKSATAAFASFNNTTDSLEAIRDRGDVAWTGGGGGGGFTGAQSVTLNFKDSGGDLVPSVTFTVTSGGSAVGSAVAGTGTTTIGLNDGSYTVTASPQNGVLFPDTALTVSGTTSQNIVGTAATATLPTQPGRVIGTLDTYDATHTLLGGVAVEFRLAATAGTTGQSHPRRVFTQYSNTSGRLESYFKPSTAYQGRRDDGTWVPFTTPASGSFDLPGILGHLEA